MSEVDENIFAQFDHNSAETRTSDEVYDVLATRPLFHSDRWDGFWAVAEMATLRDVARNTSVFGSRHGVMLPPMDTGRPLIPMEADAPQHDLYRRILTPPFSAKATAALEPNVRRATRRILERLRPLGIADLYEDVCKPIPLVLIIEMLGVDEDPRFWEWTDTLIYARLEDDAASQVTRAANGLYEFFRHVIADRRRDGDDRDDIVGLLLRALSAGDLASDDDVVDLCFFVLIAGLENTAFAIRAMLWHLAVHPDDRAALAADRSLIPAANEEGLRLYSPVPGLSRTVMSDVRVAGCELTVGERVLLSFSGANRDGKVFADPHSFRMDRAVNPHVAFGSGVHRCLGLHLARLELNVAIDEVLNVLPAYVLDDAELLSWHPAAALRARWTL